MYRFSYKYLLLALCMLSTLSSLIGQNPVFKLPNNGPWPTTLGDSIMFIGPTQDSLTEQQRYFNPPYLLVYPGKEHLKNDMIRAAICDCNPTKPNRRIGIFSVGGDQRVCFSQGNLQYLPAANLWKFADQQYQTLAHSNKYASIIYRNWIDLFGYSTDNLSTPFGVSTTTVSAHYAGKFIDWGTNPICGDMPGTWRTLGLDEWDYLLNKRTDAKKLRSLAQIEGINGLILLPDNWICPNELDFIPGANSYTSQNLTLQQWQLLETSEAVFLPAAGIRDSTSLILYNDDGNYWSATRKNNKYANYLVFRDGDTYVDARELIHIARSVRLVHDSIVPEAVDLGLSVKWATFNLGAKAPEDYGNYFAWAEIEPKDQYTWANYIWCQGTYNTLTKYCTNNDYGSIDNITIIESEDDAATMRWQGDWRIPTQAEWKELQSKCTWQWISLNGVSGYKITSKVTGYTDESIFLPAAGYRSGKSYYNHGTHGYYRSSSLYTGDPNETWRLYFHATGISLSHANDRNGGWSIRPVCGPLTHSAATVETIAATQITDQSALVGGKVSHDGGAHITEFGIVFGTNTNPTTEDNKITCSGGFGLFFTNLSSLTPHTTYYVRAFATNIHGTSYGSQITFTTGKFTPTDTTGIENGHAYVDLGLSVLWATCNVGADNPEHSGDYFAWGETEPKETYSWATYKWSDSKPSIIYKYNSDHNYGTVDNLTILQPEDDAATANWGGDWRTPTYTELNELRSKCTWVWDKVNGIAGHWVTSKTNGNRIFIPAAGYKSSKTIYNVGMSSYLESSSLRPQSVIEYFYNAFRPSYGTTGAISRYAGLNIRPVCSPHFVNKPSVTTYAATQITAQSALVPGRVTNDGGANIIEHGVVYHTSKNPTISHSKVISHDGISDFRCMLENLKTNTTYYARAFATNSAGTAYGKQITIYTIDPSVSPPSGNANGYDYVDLGLSVMWATSNVGATTPQQPGDLVAWGETTTKDVFDWNTYLWYNMEDTVITKYCVSSKYGNVDNLVILDSIDDIAAHMGGAWRMPTDEQWEELRTRCKWYWSYQNGINGYKVVADNGNSIFLPAAGYRTDTTTLDIDKNGHYWSSNLHVDFSTYARGVSFANTYINAFYNGRYCGQSVRPVLTDTTPLSPKRIGVFSVAADKQVSFSQGNLQHVQSTDTWIFAEHQYDAIGAGNIKNGALADKIDLFGWSANNTTAPFGVSTSTNAADYAGDFVDWGTNTICGDAPNTWRTLSNDEWEYLINTRPHAANLQGIAQVNGVNGLILLPDDWVCPMGVSFVHGFHSNFGEAYFAQYQQFTLDQWIILEQSGAVFLPASKWRNGNTFTNSSEGGHYWSSTCGEISTNAHYFSFGSQEAWINCNSLHHCFAVRLVHDTIVPKVEPEYVDLGLSVKWATFNVGATSPEDYGDYFAWGETEPKEVYNWTNYKWCQGTYNTFKKYCTYHEYGTVDNNVQLDAEDDAATVRWKGDWRMPTDSEWQELYKNCSWKWTTNNGVSGYLITSKIQGYTDKSIFLPAAGHFEDSSLIQSNISGYYASRSLFAGDPYEIWRVHFHSSSISISHSPRRSYGWAIRPVYSPLSYTAPSIETIAPTQVTNNSALVGGKVNNDGGATIQEFGIVYSTSPHPTTVNHRLPCQGGIGMYLVHLTDLQENTTYYVRAYTIFQQDTIYGSEANFTTGSFSPQNTSGMANGHAYIDLGLSVLWATCNLGATTPEGFGDYYAWGETKTKQSYLWSTYTLSQNNGNFLTKYNSDPAKGIVDNKTVLDLEDDAAHVHWGSNWRIPTYQEFSELRNKCTWVWTKHNGVNGYRITSPINGNSIFLPAAGYMKDIYFLYEDYPGDYETSTIFPSDNSSCYYVLLRMGYTSIGSSGRFYGLSIRPVYNENKVPDPCLVVKVNDTLSINLMCVEGGTFIMGASLEDPETLADELPQHEVTLSDYYIGKYEVTQRLWRTIMGNNPSKFIGDDLPVESVTWDECYEFLNKLNAITGLHFRLPTEAEWEYAARGGQKSKGYTYSGSNDINNVAWYQENCIKPQPVGGKKPNELGIYDMTGNVYEKCSNWYAPYPSEPQVNPQGANTPIIKNCRIVRGGCWYDQGQYTWQHCCRVVDRGYQGISDRSSYKGLRLVLEP